MCQIEIGLNSQGCCLTSARSQRRLSTIYPQTTKISNTEPERVPKTYDSQANIWWTNNNIPCSFGTFKMKTGNI